MTDGDERRAGDEATVEDVAEEPAEEVAAPDPEELGLELPDDPGEAVELLLREVATAREQAASHLDDLRRVAADFENYRKRMVREQTQQIERASERVVASLLPVLDSFDIALSHEPDGPAEQKVLDGVVGTHRLLMESLAREGLEVVPSEPGTPFDPEVHDAVSSMGEPGDRPVVTEQLRRGYRLRGRVLRPALVVVGPAEDQS